MCGLGAGVALVFLARVRFDFGFGFRLSQLLGLEYERGACAFFNGKISHVLLKAVPISSGCSRDREPREDVEVPNGLAGVGIARRRRSGRLEMRGPSEK